MKTELTVVEKLALSYKEESFSKEQMAIEALNNGVPFSLVVQISIQMDYLS